LGVYIFLDIMPNHISEESWGKVYQETLELINAYPFMDKFVAEETYDASWIYVDRAEEKVLPYRFEGSQTGWHIFGDLESMMTAESVKLVKDLKFYRHKRTDDGYDDILAKQIFHETDSGWEQYEKRDFGEMQVFDGKTQGYPHHVYLLAIACLIESRFPEHAIVYGDISIGQMEKAVEWANTILENPIHVPERAANDKLLNRIKSIIEDEPVVLEAFTGLTFHDKDFQLGEFVREHFSKKAITAYYTKRFSNYEPKQIGFRSILREFINQGFSLETTCDITVLDPDGCRYDPDDFIETVMSMEWGTDKTSPREDVSFHQDAQSEEPDTVATQFGNVFMQMAGIQESVKSNMTYREVAAVLERKLDRPVEIEDKMRGEEEVDEKVKSLMKRLGLDEADLAGKQETVTYDIDDRDDLVQWRQGDTIHPNIEKSMARIKDFFKERLEEGSEYFTEFQSLDERGKMNYLIVNNTYFYIRKQAWDQIIKDIHDPQVSIANFAILTIKADGLNLNKVCKALVNNQELLKEYILRPIPPGSFN